MAEEPYSVAKLPGPKLSSGKEHGMSQHHGATRLAQRHRRIDHTTLVTANLLSVLKEGSFTDVIFIVNKQTFRAHRAVLASQCDYFRCMLFGDMIESQQGAEITIKDTTPEAFQQLLDYLYSGRVNLGGLPEGTVIDLLGLADKCQLTDLVQGISQYLADTLNVSNVCVVAGYAELYHLTDLYKKCLYFIDSRAPQLIHSNELLTLPQSLLCAILDRDSFYAEEKCILQVVSKWLEHSKVETSQAKELLNKVRLERFSLEEILDIVRPTKLFEADCMLQALDAQRDEDFVRERGLMVPGRNMATPDMVYVVNAAWFESRLFDGNMHTYTYHYYGDEGIRIELTTPAIVNCIILHLHDTDEVSYSYYIEVSLTGRKWKNVVDYSMFTCKGLQELYFQQQMVKHFRVVGVRPGSNIQHLFPSNDMFKLVNFECYFRESPPLLGPASVVIPSQNVINIQCQEDLYLGFYEDSFISHIIEDGILIIQLPQPYYISSLKFQLYPIRPDLDCRFEYIVEVCDVYEEWEVVATRSGAKQGSWQVISFPARIVCWISINGISCTNAFGEEIDCDEFAISGIECPMNVADSGESVVGDLV